MTRAELFSIRYADKHAGALMYRRLLEVEEEVGLLAQGLEKVKTDSKKTRTSVKLLLVLSDDKKDNLPAILNAVQNSLEDHPLYRYLNFDYTAIPLSQTQWNFASYDDENYQKIFIRKRQRG